jgi:hypothetical protein
MAVKVKVRNAENGASVDMELEADNLVEEIIESAASYWQKDSGAYVLRRGKKLLKGGSNVGELGIVTGDELELIPDPEGGAA